MNYIRDLYILYRVQRLKERIAFSRYIFFCSGTSYTFPSYILLYAIQMYFDIF